MKPLPMRVDTLNRLRKTGDPVLKNLPALQGLDDAALNAYLRLVSAGGVGAVFDPTHEDWCHRAKAVRAKVEESLDSWLEVLEDRYGLNETYACTQIEIARGLFATYGEEIAAALLLVGLPEMYATAWGARVLVAHQQLETQVARRLRQTIAFMQAVMRDPRPVKVREQIGEDDTLLSRSEPESTMGDATADLVRECAALRIFHHLLRTELLAQAEDSESLRKQLGSRNLPANLPINVEDLLGTLLTFSVTTFRVLEEFGVSWTAEEQEAYLFFWDLVGACLGVEGPYDSEDPEDLDYEAVPEGWITIRPPTVAEAEDLLGQLHDRQWLPLQPEINESTGFQWEPMAHGRLLMNALLQTVVEAMPPMRKSWPALLMRELGDPMVRDRLSLHRTGLAWWMYDRWTELPESAPVPFSGRGGRTRARLLRAMAVDVAGRTVLSVLQSDIAPLQGPAAPYQPAERREPTIDLGDVLTPGGQLVPGPEGNGLEGSDAHPKDLLF
jgi:ER-bound oxygenase mpaB/B'/Rubber oxygenase, catalytic domain